MAAATPPSSSSVGCVVGLERRPAPRWLKALLLVVHLLPILLIAAGSGAFANTLPEIETWAFARLEPEVETVRYIVNVLFVMVTVLLAVLFMLVLSYRVVALGSAEQKMFRSWARNKFSWVQCLLMVSCSAWWSYFNPMAAFLPPDATDRSGRMNNPLLHASTFYWGGLVPNLLVCAFAVRAVLHQRWRGLAFEDVETLELCLTWACAVGIPLVNTVVFVLGADPRSLSKVNVQVLSSVELYVTFAVIGATMSLQPFELRTKLAVIVGNALAALAAGGVRAAYSQNWTELIIRRGALLSMWTGFMLTHLMINHMIKPYWLRLSPLPAPHSA